jgi:hypothetical protein
MADDDANLPAAYDLVPVDHQPQFADAPVPKAGQTVQQPNVMGDISAMPGKVASAVGDVTGVTEAVKAARGQMTPEEAQMFALGALPMLAGGPEAKVASEVASDIAPAATKAIRAFHGSPYDFNQFDLSKIGTGEGAQAYGHGLYFAENPATAQDYKSKLSTLANVNDSPEAKTALYYLQQNNFDKAAARADLEGQLKQKLPDSHPQVQAINNYDPGKMYEVNINADPEHFLDWDKPLSEHPPEIQDKVKQAMGIDYYGKYDPQKAERVWNQFGKAQAGTAVKNGFIAFNDETVAQRLRDAGIPGIKYLDQGSRANAGWRMLPPSDSVSGKWVVGHAPNGPNQFFENEAEAKAAYEAGLPATQTRNYVVFNDKLIDIVKKYGLAGLVAGGASHFSTVPVDHQPDFGDNQQGMATGGRIDGATSINRSYDVPYLAGSSNDDKTVYIDRRVPKRIAVKRANGKGYESIDPAEFLAEHEREEHKAMRAGKPYEKAHVENGTAAERAKVKAHGLDWDHYEEVMDGLLSHIEHEHPKRPPPDLYKKPYPHNEAVLLKRLGDRAESKNIPRENESNKNAKEHHA